jgi:hypothetical protein
MQVKELREFLESCDETLDVAVAGNRALDSLMVTGVGIELLENPPRHILVLEFEEPRFGKKVA